jgi:hypothetical protein
VPSKFDKLKGLTVINLRLKTKHLTWAAAVKSLELPFIFAGREQWLRNTTGVGVDDTPELHNVSMVNPRYDDQAAALLVGHLRDSADPKGDVRFWRGLVPDGAADVRKKLNANGVPFDVELLADPGINLDGKAPLFAKSADGEVVAPRSLFQLGVDQKGERGFLRSLSWKELMLEVWPAYFAYYHRPAGAPAPSTCLTFGCVDYVNGVRRVSPLRATAAYERWTKAGQPD